MNYIIAGILKLIALLPFTLLYALSDFLRLNMYFIFRYRKKVIIQNLRNAFPEKTGKEIKKITWEFYKNFADLLIESIKSSRISKQQLAKRIVFENPEILEKYAAKNQSLLIGLAHCGNWEWMAMQLALSSPFKVFAIVKPLRNKFWDNYYNKIRQRFSPNSLIHYKKAFRKIVENRNKLTINLIAVDQRPSKDEINYWVKFLNQDTPVYLGIEKIARATNYPVVFFDIKHIKRGYYTVRIIELFANPKNTEEFEITKKHVLLLEEIIKSNPANWLWSHKRWKFKKEKF